MVNPITSSRDASWPAIPRYSRNCCRPWCRTRCTRTAADVSLQQVPRSSRIEPMQGALSAGIFAFSVILLDVSVGPVEQFLVGVQLVLEQGPAQFLLHQPLALRGVLPVWETNLLHDVVDVGDDPFDDDVRIAVSGLCEDFGERLSCPVAFFFRIGFLLRRDDLLGEVQDLLEKLKAGEETLLMALLDLLQPLAKRGELRVAQMPAQARDQLDLDFPAALLRFLVGKDLLKHLH